MADTYEFKDNSQTMYEEVLLMTPWLFRSLSRKSFLQGFQEKNQNGVITEDIFIEVCKDKVPEKYLDETLKKCKELRTKK